MSKFDLSPPFITLNEKPCMRVACFSCVTGDLSCHPSLCCLMETVWVLQTSQAFTGLQPPKLNTGTCNAWEENRGFREGWGDIAVSDLYWEQHGWEHPSKHTHTHTHRSPHIHFPVLISWEKGLRSAGIRLNFFLSVSHTPFVSVWFNTLLPPSGGHASPTDLWLPPTTAASAWPTLALCAFLFVPLACPSLDIHKSISRSRFIQGLMDLLLSRRPDNATV